MVEQAQMLKTRFLPVDLYVPNIDVPTEEFLDIVVDVTGVQTNLDNWVRGLEDILSEIDEKYSAKGRKGGKRITLGCSKININGSEVRRRVARFVPYPQSLINRIKRLRTEAYAALKSYAIVFVSPTGKKRHFMSGEMLVDAKKAIIDLNERVVRGEIQKTIEEFEKSADYAKIFLYIKNTGVRFEPVKPIGKSFPEVTLEADQLGISSEAYKRLLDEKKRKAIEVADTKSKELLEKIEQEAEKKRREVLEAIDKDLKSRFAEIMIRLSEVVSETIRTKNKANVRSLHTLAKKASEVQRLADSLGLGTIISDRIETVEKTAHALAVGDMDTILEISKKFAESCGVSPTEDTEKNFNLAIKRMKGESLILRVVE